MGIKQKKRKMKDFYRYIKYYWRYRKQEKDFRWLYFVFKEGYERQNGTSCGACKKSHLEVFKN